MIAKAYRRLLIARKFEAFTVPLIPMEEVDTNLVKWEMKMYGHVVMPIPKKTILFMTISEVVFV